MLIESCGKSMIVVQINSVSGIGSTGKIAEGISNVLNNEGVENYIFYGIGKSKWKNSFKFGSEWSKSLHIMQTRLFGKHGFYSRKQTKKMITRIKEISPTIIHLHNIHGHYLDVKYLFKYLKESNVSVVWTLHDCWSFTGHCAYFDYVKCDKWKSVCHKCPALMEYPKSLIFDRSKGNFNEKKRIFNNVPKLQLVTPSQWLSSLIKESYLKNYGVSVINNGIDLMIFRPLSDNLFRAELNLLDKFIILGVSNVWEKRKGLNYLIELSKILSKDEVIVIVGANPTNKLPSCEKIIWMPRMNSASNLARIYSESNVFVNPTLEDNFPTTNLESIACGTPVITFDSGGSGEAIGKECGIILAEKSTSAIRKAIDNIKRKEKEFYVDKCRDYAMKNFDMNQKFMKYLELYKAIQSNKGEDL